MSITKREYPKSKRHPNGRTVWRVRWIEDGRHRSSEVDTYAEARVLEAQMIADAATPPAAAAAPLLPAVGMPLAGQVPVQYVVLDTSGAAVPVLVQGAPHLAHAPGQVPVLDPRALPLAATTPAAMRPPSPTLSVFWKEWVANRKLRCAPSTIDAYENAWGKHVTPKLGHLRLDEIAANPRVISDVLAHMAQFDVKKQKPRVGQSTRRKVYQLLNAVLRSAVAWNHLDFNPVDRLDERAASGKRVRPITLFSALHVERMRRWVLARTNARSGGMCCGLPIDVRNQRDAALLTLLAYAGLRPAEALALRWSDVDLERGIVSVLGRNSDTVRRDVKCDAALREVPLAPVLVDDLAAWRRAAGSPAGDQLVFADEDGAMWGKGDWRRWADKTFHAAAELVGKAGSRPYDLRHSYIMRLIMQGQPVPVVASLAGHNPETLVKVYLGGFRQHGQVGIEPGEDITAHLLRARRDAPQAAATGELAAAA